MLCNLPEIAIEPKYLNQSISASVIASQNPDNNFLPKIATS
jgi:hypothetical protein